MPQVSIIVPVYNASPYIERCIKSLSHQSMIDIECIFVDDCSTDGSLDLIRKVVDTHLNEHMKVKIIAHENNRGVAAARNTGLNYALGEYIGWVDSDDYVAKEMFEELYLFAKKHDADMVWCNYFNVKLNGQVREVKQALKEDPTFFAKSLILNNTGGNIWNKLIRKNVFELNNLRFIEGQDLGEDRCMLFKVLHLSKTIKYFNKSLYYYCHNNEASLTKQVDIKRVHEEINNTQEILDFIVEYKIEAYSSLELNKFKFISKKKLLASLAIDDFKNWKIIFAESNYLIKKKGVLTRKHSILAKLTVGDKWFFIKVWIFFKKIKRNVLNN